MQLEDLGFNLNNVYSLRAADGDESISIGAFRGKASLVVFRKGDRRPAVNIPLDRNSCYMLLMTLDQIKKAEPGTRLSFESSAFNRDTKKYEPNATIVIFKDDRRMYGMELSGVGVTPPIKCLFKSPMSLSMGSDPMTDADRSAIGIGVFRTFLERELPLVALFSRFNNPKQNFGGGNRSGGGNSGGSRGGDYNDSAF